MGSVVISALCLWVAIRAASGSRVREPEHCAGEPESCSLSSQLQAERSDILLQRTSESTEDASMLDERIVEGLLLSDELQKAAAELPEGPTKQLLQAFEVCTSCNEFKRLGEANDGGYLMCWDGLDSADLQAAYSMGVEQHDQWSEDVSNLLKIPVYQFDCSVDGPANNCDNCEFFSVCIEGQNGGGGYPGKENYALAKAVNATGWTDAPKRSLIMKMDIEGAEWPILAEGGTNLQQFDQLVFEFHWLDQEDKHEQYVQALDAVSAAGFSLVHIHGNNYASMYEKGGYAIPQVIEATFVSRGDALASCEREQVFRKLDAANHDGVEELSAAKLP